MNWIEGMSEAVAYIEDNLDGEINISDVARQAYVSEFYFQKAFSLLCSMTLGEYIRRRRLALAGEELAGGVSRVIDVALKYGYDSPDSFAKAFTRFHGSTPSAVRNSGAAVRSFAPLIIKFTMEGGYSMDYKIIDKEALTLIGVSRRFDNETSQRDIPLFWNEHYRTGGAKVVCGIYGVCIDDGSSSFDYIIADPFEDGREIPEGYRKFTLPAHTWAVFPCRGAMPDALQTVTRSVFSEWLPNCREYEIAGGYSVEYYTAVDKYEKGNQYENYYSEVWIPVRRKA